MIIGAEMNAEIEHASPWGKQPGEKVPGQKRRIGVAAHSPGAYANGKLWWVRGTTLFAQPMDVSRAELTGEMAAVLEHIFVDPTRVSREEIERRHKRLLRKSSDWEVHPCTVEDAFQMRTEWCKRRFPDSPALPEIVLTCPLGLILRMV